MICSSVNLLFLMSVILLMIGLHYLYAGTVDGEQVRQAEHCSRAGPLAETRCARRSRTPGR